MLLVKFWNDQVHRKLTDASYATARSRITKYGEVSSTLLMGIRTYTKAISIGGHEPMACVTKSN